MTTPAAGWLQHFPSNYSKVNRQVSKPDTRELFNLNKLLIIRPAELRHRAGI